MASVQPIVASDLNGIQLDPKDIVTDEFVSYVGFARKLCSDLGTENDSPEGFQDFINFQKEIYDAKIETFELDNIDTKHTFDLDLTGENIPVIEIPDNYFSKFSMTTDDEYSFTPFDVLESDINGYCNAGGVGMTPFDILATA
jgi:hypothetical protein